MKLSELKTGEQGVVVKISGYGAFRKRVIEMGFVRGRVVKVLLDAPLKDPIKYELLGYAVSLRRAEAEMIEVERIAEPAGQPDAAGHQPAASHLHDDRIVHTHAMGARHGSNVISVALVGNPNCGKTSLFNDISGAREHVGNYSGVTVGIKTVEFEFKGYTIQLTDLPGTYSLTAYSPEELFVRRFIRDNKPDIILNVVDASNLERNLYLTTELIDMDRSMIIALNMYDELEASGSRLDYSTLGRMIGVPMMPVVARTGQGVTRLFDEVVDIFEGRHDDVRHIHVKLGADVERYIRSMVDILKGDGGVDPHYSPRYLAIKMLQDDAEADRFLHPAPCYEQLVRVRDNARADIENLRNEDLTSIIAAEKYGFIAGALAETMQKGRRQEISTTTIIDAIVTNKLFGFPTFLLIMFFIFWLTFFAGKYPMEGIEWCIDRLSEFVGSVMPDGMLKDLIADGIIGGVGGVIVFLPNILILYYCISFMEDSGYMARAAFIMDKLMHRIGLHGKSFIPLIMGFGCNVPAIMATRSIESRSSRIITILINPFMSCSARVPLYVLLIGTFFYDYAAVMFLALYLLGIVVAIVTARLLRRFYFHKDETPFVMELPPYRMPTLRTSMRHTWAKGMEYLRKMGGIILFASIIVWALNYFPRPVSDDGVPVQETEQTWANASYLARAGKAINPLMAPLGFTWRSTVAALAGVPAKEIVVSTLSVLYTDDEAYSDASLGHRLETPGPSGKPDFTAPAALAFMIFILLYCPCMATITAIVRETGHWGYGLFSVCYNTAVAWVLAFAAYHIALLF